MLSRLIKTSFIICVIILNATIGFSREKYFKIEEVKKSDLSSKAYKDYPEAKARILFDFGKLHIKQEGDNFITSFKRHLRLKYLGDSLLSPYLLNLDFLNEVEEVLIYSIKNNKIEIANITDEWKELDKLIPFVESMKQLKSGDILEFKLSTKINSPHVVPGWQFEYEIPVDWSELNAEVPDIFVYRPVFKGYVPLLMNSAEIKLDKNGQWVEGDGYYIYNYRFVIEKIAPFKKVAFSPSSRDYLTSLDFYLEKIQSYKGRNSVQGKTWSEITINLDNADKIGKRIENFDAKPYLENLNLPSEKLEITKYIFYWLKDQMKWNDELGIVSDRQLKDVFESKTGNVAELNLLLIAFLRGAGVDSSPVLLRTVEMGKLNMALPQVSQFNYLVAYTRMINTDLLMDISEPCLEPGLLRVSCLNGKGLNINSGFEEWIDLEGGKTSIKAITVMAEINGDSLTGVVVEKRKNHLALEDCKSFNDGQEIFNFDSTITITEISYANMDSLISGNKITIKFTASHLLKNGESTIEINPFWFEKIKENPFNEDERNYPVTLPYFFKYSWNFSITLSEDYQLSDLPEGETISTPDNSMRFIYTSKQLSNILQINAQLNTLKRNFSPDAYEDLKEFYKEVIKKLEEPIKIKKN